MAYFINFNLGEFSIPLQVLVLEAGMALLVPLLAGLYPIVAGTRITVREAISSYGLSEEGFGDSAIDRLVERIRGLPRPVMLSLRNTFRRKGRLKLTLATLTLAGAIVIAVVSVRASFLHTLGEILQYFGYDAQVQLSRSYRMERLEQEALSVPGVVAVESWGSAGTYRLRPDGSDGEDIFLFAPLAETNMLNPTMLEGRWLLPEDENAIVVSTNLLMEEPDLGVGDEVVLKINDRETNWHIVGVAHVAQSVSFAFADYDHFARVVRNVGRANMISISTERREIGVMRAIGASNGAVLRVIIVEGVVIGLMSWLLATLLSLPIGKLLSNAVGIQMFNTPLSYTVSLVGVLLWLGLVVLLSVLASFVPAQSAANLSVREVLAYEQ